MNHNSELQSGPEVWAVSTARTPAALTRRLLQCGVIAGPLFIGLVVAQSLLRTGFDPKIHPLSLLSLGNLGWIQTANFIVSGALFVMSAWGIRQMLHPGRASLWGPLLVGTFGAALIWGGIFATDPAFGFPGGTPDGMPKQQSMQGQLHNFAPVIAYYALFAACFVFARRFAGLRERRWIVYCIATALVSFALSLVALTVWDFRLMLVSGSLVWGWASVMVWHLLGKVDRS